MGHSIAFGIAMRRYLRKLAITCPVLTLFSSPAVHAQKVDQLVPRNMSVKQTAYRGRAAVQVIARPDAANASSYALLKGVTFRDGAIEVDLAGEPAAGAGPAARGFIGIAFRMQNDRYEYIYLRPTNGGPMTRYAAITQPSTPHIRSSILPACARKRPKSTNRMSTWSRARGHDTGSKSTIAKRGCTSMGASNRP
jgi:hypothetical protein